MFERNRKKPYQKVVDTRRNGWQDLRPVDILLVDDDPDFLAWCGTMLEKAKYTVLIAKDVTEALDALASTDPRVIISDINMPGASGIDFCRNLRSHGLDEIPFIFCTSMDRTGDHIRGSRVGADAYVSKPVDITVLLEKLRRILRAQDFFERDQVQQEDDRVVGNMPRTGLLSEYPFVYVLQEATRNINSAIIRITDNGQAVGTVGIAHGSVTYAAVRGMVGINGLEYLFSRQYGQWVIETSDEDIQPNLVGSIDEIILGTIARIAQRSEDEAMVAAANVKLRINYGPALLQQVLTEPELAVLRALDRNGRLGPTIKDLEIDVSSAVPMIGSLIEKGLIVPN